MLTNRQKNILNILVENYSNATITTSSFLACDLGVTSKTIQNDIKSINAQIEKIGATIYTIPGKGYKFAVENEKSFLNVIEILSNKQENESMFDNKDDRLKYIIGSLIFSKRPILSDNLSNSLYISRSQFSIDIKEVKEILCKYNLSIISKSKQGLTIEGSEYDKRQCLIKEGINYNPFTKGLFYNFKRSYLTKYILDALSYEKYEISDFNLQNFIIYVETSIVRIKWGASLNEYSNHIVEFPNTHEYRIVQNIFRNMKSNYGVEANDFEISNLATRIKSIRIRKDDNAIDEETEIFVTQLLSEIKKQFAIDFSNDIELRINLGLHLNSLLIRAKNCALAENNLIDGIKQSLTLAYDIALVSASIIEKSYNIKLSEDEAGYIAVYYAMALNHVKVRSNKNRVLIVTACRKSEALLLRHNFLSKFNDRITSLEVVQANELKDLCEKDYDCVFATIFPGFIEALRFNAIHINYFLDEKDILVIENELKKKNNISPLINYFDKNLFFHNIKANDKFELIRFICNKMNELYDFDNTYKMSLYDNIIQRENNASTVFTNNIALPHPEVPFTSQTIASVVILDEPICWDDKKVQIIFLMNIKKDGEKEMEALYEFLSDFISNKNLQNRLKANPTYETLEALLASFKPHTSYNI